MPNSIELYFCNLVNGLSLIRNPNSDLIFIQNLNNTICQPNCQNDLEF
jgi:hypothetical protein